LIKKATEEVGCRTQDIVYLRDFEILVDIKSHEALTGNASSGKYRVMLVLWQGIAGTASPAITDILQSNSINSPNLARIPGHSLSVLYDKTIDPFTESTAVHLSYSRLRSPIKITYKAVTVTEPDIDDGAQARNIDQNGLFLVVVGSEGTADTAGNVTLDSSILFDYDSLTTLPSENSLLEEDQNVSIIVPRFAALPPPPPPPIKDDPPKKSNINFIYRTKK
jgi:hypothetical protein